MKIKRFYRNGAEFFTDEHGHLVSRAQIKAAASSGKTVGFINESENLTPEEIEALTEGLLFGGTSKIGEDCARRVNLTESESDTAAAKTMVGHFVRDNSAGYGSTGIYKVASVGADKATLHGPIGQGGTKTVSHSALVKNHTDMGDSTNVSQVSESARAERREMISRGGLTEAQAERATQLMKRRKRILMNNGMTEAQAEIAARGR